MLILDEAHNAAPASGAKYAVDSQLTRTVREIAPRFEHKLFLSATPHNGHSNSFAALLEILDPQRFCRGVPVRDRKLLDTVMVRRLKQDLREVGEEFPERKVIPIAIANLPEDAPELKLSRLLQEYRSLRSERLKDAAKSTQNTAMLVITSLQKRLLSSIEAFSRTLKVHRAALIKQAANSSSNGNGMVNFPLLLESPGADDDRAELAEDEIQAEDDAQITVATKQAASIGLSARELAILDEMTNVANQARFLPDPRVEALINWIKTNLCPDLGQANATWLEKRVIIFTEYTDTKRYLQQQLQAAIAGSNREQERIDVFHGGIGEERREAIKKAFNADPVRHPLRILIATDAAREGVNLQNNCADLFHFDVPWNPSRMEQRNGRIDRKLQRSPEVRCYYFVLPQRVEDRVLDVLVNKTKTIQKELGTLSPVVEKNLSRLLEKGILHDRESNIAEAIATAELPNIQTISQELEENRQKKEDLAKQIGQLQEMLKTSRDWLGLDDHHFREAISASLEILGATPLAPVDTNEACEEKSTARWTLPPLDQRSDHTWTNTFDTLRSPRQKGQKPWEWRKESPIRPVVFRDPGSLDGDVVHLHLEHRVVQRLLSRFLAQGFLHDELTRACVCLTDDPMPKVIALGRLSVYGQGASRLHDEVIAIAAEWIDPAARGRKKLQPLNEGEKDNVLKLLEDSLGSPRLQKVTETVKELLKSNATQDIADLIPHLQRRANALAERAERELIKRGQKEAGEMKKILEQQQQSILQHKKDIEENQNAPKQLSLLPTEDDEKRQLDADRRHWEKRLKALSEEIISEPARIEASYQVKAVRVEPVGLVYLWSVSG
jgi:Helicase conserved C-terminal domain